MSDEQLRQLQIERAMLQDRCDVLTKFATAVFEQARPIRYADLHDPSALTEYEWLMVRGIVGGDIR